MPEFESESIVLKSFNLAEADRIVVFLTQEHGIVRGVAKGAKRLKSRFGSTLEPFSTVQLSYFQKDDRELVSIQSVELIRSRFEAASEPAFLQTFSYIAELLVAFVPPHDPNETLYRMVRSCIDAGGENIADLAAVGVYFELWLLRLGGYLPDWIVCRECGRRLTDKDSASLQSTFALFCGTCQNGRGRTQITNLHREIFSNVQKLPPVGFIEYARPFPESVAELSAVMKRIAAHVIGREVVGEKSLAVRL
ncbi:MAG TPA: DNA repair protein RecO [Pyrinomonadaceae bacterium]|nr:DNA repair protein RecO [Pyrinomonadaceae bacterium]